MARIKMVTREFILTNVEFMAFNKANNSLVQEWCTVSGSYENDEELLKKLIKLIGNHNLTPLKIVSSEEVTELRGMYEKDFIEQSILLDPDTRKPLE